MRAWIYECRLRCLKNVFSCKPDTILGIRLTFLPAKIEVDCQSRYSDQL